jgi:hypothetical protein
MILQSTTYLGLRVKRFSADTSHLATRSLDRATSAKILENLIYRGEQFSVGKSFFCNVSGKSSVTRDVTKRRVICQHPHQSLRTPFQMSLPLPRAAPSYPKTPSAYGAGFSIPPPVPRQPLPDDYESASYSAAFWAWSMYLHNNQNGIRSTPLLIECYCLLNREFQKR